MTKKEIENKILAINLKMNNTEEVLDEVFRIGLDNEILNNYNGFDPMETVLRVVNNILNDIEEELNETETIYKIN